MYFVIALQESWSNYSSGVFFSPPPVPGQGVEPSETPRCLQLRATRLLFTIQGQFHKMEKPYAEDDFFQPGTGRKILRVS